LNEIKKTKLQIYTEPQAGVNILLPAIPISRIYFTVEYFIIMSKLFRNLSR